MEKRIIAAFENVDSAEQAARWIKNSYNNVTRIQMTDVAVKTEPHAIAVMPSFGGAVPNIPSGIVTGFEPFESSNNAVEAAGPPVHISVTATGSWQGIETTLRAFGGSKIDIK